QSSLCRNGLIFVQFLFLHSDTTTRHATFHIVFQKILFSNVYFPHYYRAVKVGIMEQNNVSSDVAIMFIPMDA
ncbi:hypothetical protein L9F63_021454, partial [Diploptera punctata]